MSTSLHRILCRLGIHSYGPQFLRFNWVYRRCVHCGLPLFMGYLR